jgi:hypothetical protein
MGKYSAFDPRRILSDPKSYRAFQGMVRSKGSLHTPAAYLEIARRHFPDARASVFHDLLAVPYTHCIIEAQAPSSAA